MRFQLRCESCGATCWVRGHEEPDVNATILDDNAVYEWEPEEPHCTHEDFEILDSEYDSDDDY